MRLAISVEGLTESEFVTQVLAEPLRAKGMQPQPVVLGRPGHKGGNVTVERMAEDMARLYWSFDVVTSLVDFYGFRNRNSASPDELEKRILQAIKSKIRTQWNQSRVLPYVQQYEFEGLLFSDVSAFQKLPAVSLDVVEELKNVRLRYRTPEDINDGTPSAPSKRLIRLIPRYKKAVDGPIVAQAIGLIQMRAECHRFNAWIDRLEAMGTG